MKVLIGCEFSQVVTTAFRNKGHEAYSCDLLPTEGNPNWHIQDDVLKIIEEDHWDLAVFHPPCTFLCVTGNRWMGGKYRERFPTREQDRKDATEFFMRLVNAPIPKIAIENPVGIMSSHYRRPDQYVQPYWFGHPQGKKTGLWLKNLPKLTPTNMVEEEPRVIPKCGHTMAKWHVDIGKLPMSERAALRGRTFRGFAEAMADQWGAV